MHIKYIYLYTHDDYDDYVYPSGMAIGNGNVVVHLWRMASFQL